jgi:hypothetical protein
MKELIKAWKEKRIEKEEKGEDSRDDRDSQGREDSLCAETIMVFELSREFHLPEDAASRVDLGAERAIFEKPDTLRQHRRPLYI